MRSAKSKIQLEECQLTHKRFTRYIYAGIGLILLGIGGIGVVVPGLPTFMFWVFASLCFGKSCPALQRWIYRRPHFGPMVEQFVKDRTLSRTSKRRALIGMWLGMSGSMLVIAYTGGPAWVLLAIALSGIVATYWIKRGIATSDPDCFAPDNSQALRA